MHPRRHVLRRRIAGDGCSDQKLPQAAQNSDGRNDEWRIKEEAVQQD